MPLRELRSFAVALAGIALITALIGLVRPWLDVPSLAVAYVLLVLWVGSVWGRLRAVGTAIIAFLTYEFFFVPPYGTLLISAPKDVLNLLFLLAAAIIGGQLAASLLATRRAAEEAALTSAILYEVAITALRERDVSESLHRVVEAGDRISGVESMTLLDLSAEEVLAGPPLPASELSRARWAGRSGTPIGLRLSGGQVELVRTSGPPEACRHLPLNSGLVSLRLPGRQMPAPDRRLLAALLALAGLLLDRRRADLESERMLELEASDRLKAAVLSSLSHELKSPLASLRAGLSTLSLPAAGLEGDQREIVQGLDGQADRLDRLVGDLLTMSRLEAGLPLERQPVSLPELVGSALQELHALLKPFQVEVALEDELPTILADEVQLDRVLVNLLANAAEWTPPGGRIEVGAARSSAGATMWVQNEGSDIPPVDLDRIFEKFWTRRKTGSGLGLAICKRIVDAHGGTIRAENRRGGPRFSFTLPIPVEATV